ncbi:hypothetical protein GGI26_005994, partial [Coemansia sp. RSA 1358]
ESPNDNGLYEIELEDTIIFPEGGGQPSDTGSISGIEVKISRRQGLRAIHHAAAPIEAGSVVYVEVDFKRRLDHMQQHSGQHLLSAVLARECGLRTVSWSLGSDVSHVELDTAKDYVLQQHLLNEIESKCNALIFQSLPMTVRVYEQSAETCPSSIPVDYVGGVVRCVEIGKAGEKLDQNTCCGTHVTNTSQLQILKLAGTDRVRGGNTRLFFYVGDRICKYAHGSLQRDKRLAELLSCPPEIQCEAVERAIRQSKLQAKSLKSLRRLLVPLVAKELHQRLSTVTSNEQTQSVLYHCEDGDGAFAIGVANELVKLMEGPSIIKWAAVIAAGTKTEGGQLVITGGSSDTIKNTLSRIAPVLGEHKGGFSRGMWQGKASSFLNLENFSLD